MAMRSRDSHFLLFVVAWLRYISSTLKSRGVLMRQRRCLCSSFIILLHPIPAALY